MRDFERRTLIRAIRSMQRSKLFVSALRKFLRAVMTAPKSQLWKRWQLAES
jgi:hypothetical protein